ncbi:MAG: glutamate racemase [Clostridia bacterium]|nr:glutamate racemase [Clostridia bacterium]
MDERCIGVFDSGVGGISVLKCLVDVLPNEKYIYYGDTKNAPYGDRSAAEILALTRSCVDKLLSIGIKALVIACNTATAAAVFTLRQQMNIPIIGMEPALKPAALDRLFGNILVMATQATLSLDKFKTLMEKYGQHALLCPCPGLMEFAERGETNSRSLDEYLENRLAPYRNMNIESVVLGCTHYVFLKDAIARVLPGVKLYDGNYGTAKRLMDILSARDSLSDGPGEVRFMSSDDRSVDVMRFLFYN